MEKEARILNGRPGSRGLGRISERPGVPSNPARRTSSWPVAQCEKVRSGGAVGDRACKGAYGYLPGLVVTGMPVATAMSVAAAARSVSCS